MIKARCYECPACGGLVRESLRKCGYCGSDVATVRCGRCFMMNVTEAAHCIGCGAELGLMPVTMTSEQTVACPRCKTTTLDAFANDGGLVYDCGHCGGQFVGNDVLATMVSRHQTAATELPLPAQRHNPLDAPVVYLACPFCRELMLRRNFGRQSGIVVDVCSRHGTWFDTGELPRILAFVARGGLQAAQRATEAERQWVSAQIGPASTSGAARFWPLGATSEEPGLSLAEMQEATWAFVRWVRDLLK